MAGHLKYARAVRKGILESAVSAALVIVGCLASCAPDAATPIAKSTAALAEAAAPARLKYFGFYFVDVGLDDPHDTEVKTNFSDEVAAFSNLAQMAAYTPTDNLRARIQLMNDGCLKPFVSFQEVLFRQVDKVAPSGHHYKLYDDYRARWATFRTTNAPAFTAAKVGAFYLLDEPVWNGVTFAELDAVSQMVKTDFPDVPILLVEAYPSLGSLQVPVTVDWVGFDRYAIFKPSMNASFLGNIATLKSKLSTPNQRLFLTIDDQWVPEYGRLGVSAAQMDSTIADYYDLAVSDPMVIGLLGYLWAGGIGGITELGVRNMPKSIIDLNKQIGTKIKANGPSCAASVVPDAAVADARASTVDAKDMSGADSADARLVPDGPPGDPAPTDVAVNDETDGATVATPKAAGCECQVSGTRGGNSWPAFLGALALCTLVRRKVYVALTRYRYSPAFGTYSTPSLSRPAKDAGSMPAGSR